MHMYSVADEAWYWRTHVLDSGGTLDLPFGRGAWLWCTICICVCVCVCVFANKRVCMLYNI